MNEFNPYPYMPRLDYTQPLKQSPPQVKIFNVNGRAGAEAFNLAPDSSIFLLDSKDPVIWLVTTDSAATKTITRIKAVIEEEPAQSADRPARTAEQHQPYQCYSRFQLCESSYTESDKCFIRATSSPWRSDE